jgi:hypothetical protein
MLLQHFYAESAEHESYTFTSGPVSPVSQSRPKTCIAILHSRIYYARFRNRGKSIHRSLQTTDRKLPFRDPYERECRLQEDLGSVVFLLRSDDAQAYRLAPSRLRVGIITQGGNAAGCNIVIDSIVKRHMLLAMFTETVERL